MKEAGAGAVDFRGSGFSKLATSVFGKREQYELQFNHEDDGCWYVDYPGWPFDHHHLMKANAGRDKLHI